MIPLELITMLGSSVLGGVMSIWAKNNEAQKTYYQSAIDALAQKQKGWKEARETKEKGFQITRRWIALMSIFSIVVLPKLAAIFDPNLLVTVGYHEWNPGFLFIEGKDSVLWKEAKGLTITPLDTHMVAGIVGLYFGNKFGR